MFVQCRQGGKWGRDSFDRYTQTKTDTHTHTHTLWWSSEGYLTIFDWKHFDGGKEGAICWQPRICCLSDVALVQINHHQQHHRHQHHCNHQHQPQHHDDDSRYMLDWWKRMKGIFTFHKSKTAHLSIWPRKLPNNIYERQKKNTWRFCCCCCSISSFVGLSNGWPVFQLILEAHPNGTLCWIW